MAHTQQEVFAKCENLGEAKVRELLNGGQWHERTRVAHAQEWLRLREEARNESSATKQLAIALSQLEIARSQLRIDRTQKYTAIAALITTIIIAAITIYLSC